MSLTLEEFLESHRQWEKMDERLTKLIGFNPATSDHYGQIRLYNHRINSETPDDEILKLRSTYVKWRTEILGVFKDNGLLLDDEQFNKLFAVDYMFGTITFLGERLDLSKDMALYRKSVGDYINMDMSFKIKNGVLEKYTGKERFVVVPNGVKEIGKEAFRGCKQIVSIDIPHSVTSINDSAFKECSDLADITIPHSITSLGNFLFEDCSSLKHIEVDKENKVYHSTDNCIIETETKLLVFGCGASIIPNDGSVMNIAHSAFGHCTGLTTIDIPGNIEYIDNYAFKGCANLASVNILPGVKYIGDYAFGDCERLSDIIIPNSVKEIGEWAFSNCSSLETINIPSSLEWIHGITFEGCTNLTSIIVDVDNETYYSSGNCLIETDSGKLIRGCATSVIPNNGSITSIGDFAFQGCGNLIEITIPSGIKEIGDYAFSDCKCLTHINIPYGVTTLGEGVFVGCEGLLRAYLPDSIRDIGPLLFAGCENLTFIEIPEYLTYISYDTFDNCKNLTCVKIPRSVIDIEDSSFGDCENLVIIAPQNSFGAKYAKKNNISLILLPEVSRFSKEKEIEIEDIKKFIDSHPISCKKPDSKISFAIDFGEDDNEDFAHWEFDDFEDCEFEDEDCDE